MKFNVHSVCGTVHALSRPKFLPFEGMGDHDGVAQPKRITACAATQPQRHSSERLLICRSPSCDDTMCCRRCLKHREGDDSKPGRQVDCFRHITEQSLNVARHPRISTRHECHMRLRSAEQAAQHVQMTPTNHESGLKHSTTLTNRQETTGSTPRVNRYEYRVCRGAAPRFAT